MDCFKRCLGERCADVFDWVDYRPDADFRWLALAPVLFALGWAYSGPFGIAMIASFALLATLVVAALGLVALAGWILGNALADAASTLRLRTLRPHNGLTTATRRIV